MNWNLHLILFFFNTLWNSDYMIDTVKERFVYHCQSQINTAQPLHTEIETELYLYFSYLY